MSIEVQVTELIQMESFAEDLCRIYRRVECLWEVEMRKRMKEMKKNQEKIIQ